MHMIHHFSCISCCKELYPNDSRKQGKLNNTWSDDRELTTFRQFYPFWLIVNEYWWVLFKYFNFYSPFYGVMVSTSDSESGDPSSNLGRTSLFRLINLWINRKHHNIFNLHFRKFVSMSVCFYVVYGWPNRAKKSQESILS